jgi:hypothetical protein
MIAAMRPRDMAVFLLLAGWGAEGMAAAPGAGATLTAEQAMETYRRGFGDAARCSLAGAEDEVVVCGHRPLHPDRLPLPIEREPGEVVRHAGEPASGGGALAAGGCNRLCEQPITIDPIKAAIAVPKIIRHILHGDD